MREITQQRLRGINRQVSGIWEHFKSLAGTHVLLALLLTPTYTAFNRLTGTPVFSNVIIDLRSGFGFFLLYLWPVSVLIFLCLSVSKLHLTDGGSDE